MPIRDPYRPLKYTVTGFFLIICFTIGFFTIKNALKEEIVFEKTEVKLTTQKGKVLYFNTDIADTEARRNHGFMNRYSLANNDAMLFLFDKPQKINMWMRNTYVALDMLFIKDKKIVNIEHNALILSDKIIPSVYEVDSVLEIPGRTCEDEGIKIGDVIEYNLDDNL